MTITPVSLVFIIASLSWMSPARLVRAEVLSLRERDFVEAARAVGAGNLRIIFYHLLPNTLAPALVTVTLLVAHAILIESALSFLGFGIQPPDPSWGNMLYTAQRYIRDAPWMGVFPGLMIALTVMSINFLGDGLREAVDPRLRV
jgi:peptide/nickel transport system permease protein